MSARKALLAFALVLLVSISGAAQALITGVSPGHDLVTVQFQNLTSSGATQWFDLSPYTFQTHLLSFTYATQPGAITIALECSYDGGATVGATLGTSTSTTGSTISGTGTCSAVRANVTSLTGSVNVRVVYSGTGTPGLVGANTDLDQIAAGIGTTTASSCLTTDSTAASLVCLNKELVKLINTPTGPQTAANSGSSACPLDTGCTMGAVTSTGGFQPVQFVSGAALPVAIQKNSLTLPCNALRRTFCQ